MFALVVIGPPGSGKTTVTEALSDALVADDVRHAVIETEALTSTHPALEDAQWYEHVASSCVLFRRHGHELLLVVATVENDIDLRRLLAAIGAEEEGS